MRFLAVWALLIVSLGPVGAGAEIAYLALSGDYWQVWLVGEDGANARQLTDSAYEKTRCDWFPDGGRLLVNALDGRLFEVDVETGAERRIELPMEGMLDATVSPDGTRIAFSVSKAGTLDDNEIWTLGLDGSDARRLTNMPWRQHLPRWAPDGSWIYFLSGEGQHTHDIWRVSPETASTEQLTAGALYHFEVDVAADGRLAFSSNRTGDYEIYTQAPGEAPVQRTSSPGLDGAPRWSPDGEALVFHSARGGSLDLWRLESGEGDPVRLTDHAEGARAPAWGPVVRQ